MSATVDVLAVMDSDARQAWEWRFRNGSRVVAHAEFEKSKQAYAAVSELMKEHATTLELLRIQDETMIAFRELVEHRNRQLIALGGEP
jgi:hypothetical protein